MKHLPRLKKRVDFLRVAKEGIYTSSSTLVVQYLQKKQDSSMDSLVRVGFTASKRVGNAVLRNRAKRRMREIAFLWAKKGNHISSCDLVMIAKSSLPAASFRKIQDDFDKALSHLKVM